MDDCYWHKVLSKLSAIISHDRVLYQIVLSAALAYYIELLMRNCYACFVTTHLLASNNYSWNVSKWRHTD